MRIEVLHGRDPDAACELTIFVDGERVAIFVEEDVDPGAGHDVESWDEHTDYVAGQAQYSQAFRDAVVAERVAARGSQYVEGDKDPEDAHESPR